MKKALFALLSVPLLKSGGYRNVTPDRVQNRENLVTGGLLAWKGSLVR